MIFNYRHQPGNISPGIIILQNIGKDNKLLSKHPEEDEVIETIEEIMDEREERGDDVLVEKDEMSG